MELTECILNRRSIRSYVDVAVSEEEITEMINAAIAAPSWKNSQTARFYIVLSEDKVNDFREACLPDFNQRNTANAAAYIVSTVVTGISGFNSDGSYSSHLGKGWQYFDNGLAVQNICLKAYEMGYGTLIMGLYDNDKVREFFGVPDTETVCAVIAVGKSAVSPEMPKRKSVDEVAKFL